MAKLTAIKRFILEDFPAEPRKWLIKLIAPLNQFLDQTLTALQGGLTIRDNFKATTYQLSVSANQAYPMRLSYGLNERPTDVRIASLVENSGAPTAPTAAPFPYWTYDNGQLSVTFIGLDASKKWSVTLVAQV
jgi:hypothetical protein